jgi:4-amino-4-deoxy-L-arabinose transferase-like glycosyltransferase
MNGMILVLIGILALIVLVGIIFIFFVLKKKKEGTYKEPDYRAFFIMGICFLPMGIVFTTTLNPGFIGFIVLGIAYMTIGLANRDKWKTT